MVKVLLDVDGEYNNHGQEGKHRLYCLKNRVNQSTSLLFKEQKQKRPRWILGFSWDLTVSHRDAPNIHGRKLFIGLWNW